MTRTGIITALTISLISSIAAATETIDEATDAAAVDLAAEDNTGAHTHDGFFLRLVGGSMAMGIGTSEEGGSSTGIASVGGAFEASVGGIVAENLALHVDFLSASGEATWAESPENEVFSRNQDVELTAVGIGITRYFMPNNVYLSGSLMSTWLRTPTFDDEDNVEMAIGYGGLLSVRAGKEWWVGDDWGLGVTGSLFAGAGVFAADDANVLGYGGATIGVSATFN